MCSLLHVSGFLRFIQLEDCPHIMELENMDTFMMADKETIAIRTCPFCRKPIINTARYKDLINKTITMEINPVKERVYGTNEQIKLKYEELLEKVMSMKSYCENDPEQWKKIHLSIVNLQKTKNRMSLLSLNMVFIRLEIVEMLADLKMKYELFDDGNELKMEITCHFIMIKQYVNRIKKKISQQQQMDVGNELSRLHFMIRLKEIISSDKYECAKTNPKVEEAFAEAKRNVLGWKVFDKKKASEVLDTLQKAVNLSGIVTKQERELVVKAIGLKAGHWYKCPNGHFYCIGECGGAMQVSKCIECGVAIGGQSHTLLSGNAHAPEMDGSRFAAWSDQYNNMANFDLD